MDSNDKQFMDALSKLNNELVNTQRELTKKNVSLKLEKERYQALSELIANFAYGIKVSSTGIHIEWITESCHKLTGYTAKELPHRDGILQIIHNDDLSRAKEILDRVIQDKNKLSSQYRFVTRNSETRHSMNYYQPVVDDETQQVIRIYVATQDITPQVIIENTRKQLVTQENRFKLLSDFITLVSHEFFTPISIIKTSLHMLKRLVTHERAHHHLDKIDAQSGNITKLVDSLRTIIELEDLAHNFQFVRLDDIVTNILGRLHDAIKAKQLTILVDNTVDVYGNGEYLSMAIGNILENAIKFSSPNGTISIRSYHQQDRSIIEVKDEGAGIAEADLPFIFERFYRSNAARAISGAGLGLTIAKVIIEHHQGEIEVETESGVGSIFRIILPTTTSNDDVSQ